MLSNHSPASSLSAWIDESIITRKDHPGAYTLASVITDPISADDLRHALRDLREKRLVRLHWKAESPKRRDLIAHAIAGFDITAIVALGTPLHRQKQERARRCCLECLLYELEAFGVTKAWLECRSRTGAISAYSTARGGRG